MAADDSNGVSYNRHEGNLQDSAGAILDVSRSSLQAGLGAGAVGAGTTNTTGPRCSVSYG